MGLGRCLVTIYNHADMSKSAVSQPIERKQTSEANGPNHSNFPPKCLFHATKLPRQRPPQEPAKKRQELQYTLVIAVVIEMGVS